MGPAAASTGNGSTGDPILVTQQLEGFRIACADSISLDKGAVGSLESAPIVRKFGTALVCVFHVVADPVVDGLDLLVLSGVRKRADITLRAGDSSCDSRPVFGVGMAIVALCVRGGGLCIALIAQFKASNVVMLSLVVV